MTAQRQLPRRRIVQPGDYVQQRAFAAAGRSDDGYELAFFGAEVNVVQRRERLPSVLERLG